MYDGHGEGAPEPVQRASPDGPPFGVKVLLGFALLSLFLTVTVVLGTPLGTTVLLIDVLRVGLLFALLGMRPWAWTAYLYFQFGSVVVYSGWLFYGGNTIFRVVFALVVIRYLYSIRDRYDP